MRDTWRPSKAWLRHGLLNALGVLAVVVAVILVLSRNLAGLSESKEFLNVSYAPTKELYDDIDRAFSAKYAAKAGRPIEVRQSHGGSSSQARAVIDGLNADVVTLALGSDIESLRVHGLLPDGWAARLPNQSVPYTSTIVFLVRKGNPRHIHDFPDLVATGVDVVTPSPKTSGNGKLALLAAWGSILHRGGTTDDARAFVKKLLDHTVSLDASARDAANRFAYDKVGDVLVTWENEAWREVEELKDEFEIVYPPASIRAEPAVAWIDANVRHKGHETVAKEYLQFLFDDEAQEIIARHHYRPVSPAVLDRHHADFPDIELFPVTTVAPSWADAQREFFEQNGIFDAIYVPRH